MKGRWEALCPVSADSPICRGACRAAAKAARVRLAAGTAPVWLGTVPPGSWVRVGCSRQTSLYLSLGQPAVSGEVEGHGVWGELGEEWATPRSPRPLGQALRWGHSLTLWVPGEGRR